MYFSTKQGVNALTIQLAALDMCSNCYHYVHQLSAKGPASFQATQEKCHEIKRGGLGVK